MALVWNYVDFTQPLAFQNHILLLFSVFKIRDKLVELQIEEASHKMGSADCTESGEEGKIGLSGSHGAECERK
jgi:hypothetical protein